MGEKNVQDQSQTRGEMGELDGNPQVLTQLLHSSLLCGQCFL